MGFLQGTIIRTKLKFMKCIKSYSLSAVVLPAAIHSLQEGKVVQRLCELHVKVINNIKSHRCL